MQPLTPSQLREAYEEIALSSHCNLTADHFRKVCESHRDLLVPSNYSQQDFNTWIEEQFCIILQRCNKEQHATSRPGRVASKSRARTTEKRISGAFQPSGSKKKYQPRQLRDMSQSPDHSLDAQRTRKGQSVSSQSRIPRIRSETGLRREQSKQSEKERSDGSESPPQSITFEAFSQNYYCTVTLRQIVYMVVEEIRMRRSQQFRKKHDSNRTKYPDKEFKSPKSEVYKESSSNLEVDNSYGNREFNLSTIREIKHVIGAHTARRPETAQRGNQSYTTRSENLRYKAPALFYETADDLLMSDSSEEGKRKDQRSVLPTVETKNEEEYEDVNMDSGLTGIGGKFPLPPDMRSPHNSSGCTVQIGSRVSDHTMNNLQNIGHYLSTNDLNSPSQTSQNMQKEAPDCPGIEIENYDQVELRLPGQSLLAAAVHSKGPTFSDLSIKERKITEINEEPGLKVGDIQLAFKQKENTPTFYNKPLAVHQEMPEEISQIPVHAEEDMQSNSRILTAGDQTNLPSSRISSLQPPQTKVFKTKEEIINSYEVHNNEGRKMRKIPKKLGKGCGCTGGKGCFIF